MKEAFLTRASVLRAVLGSQCGAGPGTCAWEEALAQLPEVPCAAEMWETPRNIDIIL